MRAAAILNVDRRSLYRMVADTNWEHRRSIEGPHHGASRKARRLDAELEA